MKRVASLLRRDKQQLESAAFLRGKIAAREELTRYLEVEVGRGLDRNDYVLNEKPGRSFVEVLLVPRGYPLVPTDHYEARDIQMRSSTRLGRALFEAVRMSWNDGKGNTVHWYNWQFKGAL